MMEYDIHTFLDLLTLLATLLVIYMLWFPLKDSYQAAEDNIQSYYVVRLLHDANAMGYLQVSTISPLQHGRPHKLTFRIQMQAVPCLILACIAKPGTQHKLIFRVSHPISSTQFVNAFS